MNTKEIFGYVLIIIGILLLYGLISFQLGCSQVSGCRGSFVDLFNISVVQAVVEILFTIIFLIAFYLLFSNKGSKKTQVSQPPEVQSLQSVQKQASTQYNSIDSKYKQTNTKLQSLQSQTEKAFQNAQQLQKKLEETTKQSAELENQRQSALENLQVIKQQTADAIEKAKEIEKQALNSTTNISKNLQSPTAVVTQPNAPSISQTISQAIPSTIQNFNETYKTAKKYYDSSPEIQKQVNSLYKK